LGVSGGFQPLARCFCFHADLDRVTFPVMGYYANTDGHVSVAMTFVLIFANQLLGIGFSMILGRFLFLPLVKKLTAKRAVI